jgi:hypothetical protein
MRKSAWIIAFAGAGSIGLVIQGCAGDVVGETAGGTTGGATSGGGGKAETRCGGVTGATCAADEWCRYDVAGSCGDVDVSGTCEQRPTTCDEDCPGICGCDGQFYCNGCLANAAGLDVSSDVDCLVMPGEGYSAVALATGVPRYAIFKAMPAAGLCVRLVVAGAGLGGDGYGITSTMNWTVENAEITNDPADCALSAAGFPVEPASMVVGASGGSGSLKQDSIDLPCTVDIHATLNFPQDFPWVPPTASLDADGLVIQGAGCGP